MISIRITFTLLIAIFVSFALQIFIGGYTQAFYLDPNNLQIWQFVTSMFLHGGVMHILFNSYALFAFGPLLERRLGSTNFLILYFLCGILGNVLYYLTILFGIAMPIPALGASGAIFGIFGGLVITDPKLTLLIFGIIPMNIRYVAILWFALEFIGAFDSSSGVASAAHLGGLVAGYLLVKYYFKRKTYTVIDPYSWKRYQDRY